MFHRFANPARFMALANILSPWLTVAATGLLVAGLYFGLLASPPDYQQGETVRIMYVHVPAAWMALFVYVALAGAGGAFLIWRHPLADIFAQAAAPLGAGFTAAALITGSLWGKPMWGTWWVWDARLTSVLVLFFLYLGFIALANAFDDAARGEKASAILALIGGVNLPIIKFSVDWWNTLHQPASFLSPGSSGLDPAYVPAFLTMLAAYGVLFSALWLSAIRTEVRRRRVVTLRARRALEA